ncbi:MAG: deoxyribodipyrimidine photolyase [Acidimicrobiia bacterium]|nr:deoxyribodipyrimidine photolyase [Acidimicrobiia bacterium]
MATTTIDPARIATLNDAEPREARYVLYWMQASVRTRENHALEHAVRTANSCGLPLLVGFGLDPNYPEAEPRAMRFLVDGLVDVANHLAQRNIGFTVRAGSPIDVALDLASDAAAVVVDRNYLRKPRAWRQELASAADVRVEEVESNVVVPVEVASDKREWAARTIRPRIHEHLDRFVEELRTTAVEVGETGLVSSLAATNRQGLLEAIGLEEEADKRRFVGGELAAQRTMRQFVDERLPDYGDAGTEVTGAASSHLSMYLHYGHLSPAAVVRAVRQSGAPAEAIDDFVEELVVRRELAHNFVWYEPDYDEFRALPEWARQTLADHREDERDTVYTKGELEAAETDDPYWNAAMTELRLTGYMHNRMRMYWGKRILGWTNTPQYGYQVALELNNRYFLDGRDPNSYANVGWIFGLHDQAFEERDVIGKVRPMTKSGLERKIDTEEYVAYVNELAGSAE